MSPRQLSTAPDVYVIHPGAYLQCMSYAVRSETGWLVIDPGSGCEWQAVLDNLQALGCALPAVRAVLLTHTHVDHALGAWRWQVHGVPLLASRTAAARLAGADASIWGEHPELIRPTAVDRIVDNGELLQLDGVDLHCLLTPGHCDCHLTYVLATAGGQLAFTGDVLMPNGHPGWAGGAAFSEAATRTSLEQLRKLQLSVAATGHGVVAADVDDWLREALAAGREGRWQLNRDWQSTMVPPALLSA